jgi:hypothetical protein
MQGIKHSGGAPFRYSVTSTLYGDSLRDSMPLSPGLEGVFTSMLAGMVDSEGGARRVIGARPVKHKARIRKRD